jgi:ABC-2 type transport system ATP-binding protein
MHDPETALATRGLTKRYGSLAAVDNLDLTVTRGEIFGFLGPNGAGKTTTIRMILGLVRPTAGSIELLSHDLAAGASRVLTRVGALIESPALYGYLSGRDNLRVLAGSLGGVPRGRIDAVLELVGLADRQRDRVRRYSLGMKQRLGVAAALLRDPELVILDEPANGLDPAGIVEMRDLLRRLADDGRTVLLSSHVLAEVQQVCGRVAVLDHGRLVRVAAIADLLLPSGEFEVRLPDAAAALVLVRRQPWGATARIEDGVLITRSPSGLGRDLTEFLVRSGCVPDSVAEQTRDLEKVFMSLTGGSR